MTAFRKLWVPALAAALLLWAPLRVRAGQDRSPANDSTDQAREMPRAEPPSEPPSASPSAPQAEPPAPSDPASDDSSDGSSGRTAVPVDPDARGHGPSRQPPTRHGHGGGQGDGPDALAGEPQPDWNGQAYDIAPAVPSRHHGAFGRGAHDGMGALDLDISPGRAQVLLNGQSLGIADDYDGWPRYLWLPPGTYDLAFSLDGYQTLARQVTVLPGLVIDMDDRLQPVP